MCLGPLHDFCLLNSFITNFNAECNDQDDQVDVPPGDQREDDSLRPAGLQCGERGQEVRQEGRPPPHRGHRQHLPPVFPQVSVWAGGLGTDV